MLGKLKELGFDSFEFNEKLDFTKETYRVNTLLFSNDDIVT